MSQLVVGCGAWVLGFDVPITSLEEVVSNKNVKPYPHSSGLLLPLRCSRDPGRGVATLLKSQKLLHCFPVFFVFSLLESFGFSRR